MKKIFVKIALWTLLFILILTAAYGSFFIWQMIKAEKRISTDKTSQSFFETFKNIADNEEIDLAGASDGRINILLLGVAGNEKPGKNLSDTIMLASVDLKDNRVALLSVPRDLYIEIPESQGFQTKINTIYQLGLSENEDDVAKSMEVMKNTIKSLTSLDIHYWAVVNFQGFEKVIEAVDGINIMNEYDIYDTRYPGPGFSYETFELKKGFHKLDGKTALKYARTRHDKEGDFGRAKRQQQVLQATKNKIFSTGTLLHPKAVMDLFDALGENVKTNIRNEEIGDFLALIRKIDTDNITNVVLDAWSKESLLKVSHLEFENLRAFILVPRVGNWSEVHDLAQNIFDTDEIKRKRDEISRENAKVAVINRSGSLETASRVSKLMKENFEYKNVINLGLPGGPALEESILYDMTKGEKPFTSNELATKLPAKISYEKFPGIEKISGNVDPDIILVIGKDLTARYNMVEASFEEYNRSVDTHDYAEFMLNRGSNN